jgi:pyridoxamine 5'-phosphate oxidase
MTVRVDPLAVPRPDPSALPELDVRELDDPLARVQLWWSAAKADPRIEEPAAMTLATVDDAGRPAARVVLLRFLDDGFVFFTNFESDKGRHLRARPACALTLYFMPQHRQIRVEGDAVVVDDAFADAYFASRPRESQLSAWASDQSRPLDHEAVLDERLAAVTRRFGDGPVARPPFWGGFRVRPQRIEFWQEGPFRRHRRDRYDRVGAGFTRGLLFP